jgi:hypothetical protein
MFDSRDNKEAGEPSEQLTKVQDPQKEDPPSKCQTEVTPEIDSSVNVSSSSSRSAEPMNGDQLAHPRSTGPRTSPDKHRSSRNALKHGIFSDAVLLKGESREKYESLLRQLWEALQPEGRLEDLLVEKLATIAWRYRRLLIAEAAEIRRGTESLEWDQRIREQYVADELGATPALEDFGENVGLIRKIRNPDILERCLELLIELQREIKADGFDRERDTEIFEKIYGSKDHLRATVQDNYSDWVDTAELSEEERHREGCATPEECKQEILHDIHAEIGRLKRYRQTLAAVESDRAKLEILRRNVPESPGLDRLLRYEASLERAFDRTLSQLERLQRQRRGQPVAPRIDINVVP